MQQASSSAGENHPKIDSAHVGERPLLLDGRQWLYVQNKYKLTPRERQIAELICLGLRNGNIAQRLHIRPGTVKTHVRNIYRKAQVESKISMLLRFVSEARGPSRHYDRLPAVRIVEMD